MHATQLRRPPSPPRKGFNHGLLGDLGDALEQQFFDQLELWNREQKEIVGELGDPRLIDREEFELVVRLAYRIRWNQTEDAPEHWVDFPKNSDPEANIVDRVPRLDREAIPFGGRTGGRPLDLGARGAFRRLIERTGGDDFAETLDALEGEIEDLAGAFSQGKQLSSALAEVFEHARLPLGLASGNVAEAVRFLPDGGSLAGLMRSLAPAVDLGHDSGHLPLYRHGSTVTAILATTQAVASIGQGGMVVVDDFGEGLDAAATQHLAAALRRTVSQVWLSTRRPTALEAFAPSEIVRLARDAKGARQVFYGREPTSRSERLAHRHLAIQLLPAIASRAVIVVEGAHDRAAYDALARRLFEQEETPLPAAEGITLIDAASTDGSGGVGAIPRLAALARDLGLWVVALLDHDGSGAQARSELEAALEAAHAVVRLPPSHAIEKALLAELDEETIRTAVGDLASAFSLTPPSDFPDVKGERLLTKASKLLKKAGGLHAQFLEVLPLGVHPPLARRALAAAIQAASQRRRGEIPL